MTATPAPTVTVVVPTYNRAAYLAEVVKQLRCLEPPPGGYDVMIVDDGSTDGTPEVLAQLADEHVRIVHQPNAGPAAARNAGARATMAPFIAFTDDDCRPAADWLMRLVARMEDPLVAMAGGRTISASTSGVVARYMRHRHVSELPFSADGEVQWVITANALARRSAFEAVGGFNESFPVPGGEDPELCTRLRRAGFRLVCEPDAVVLHDQSWRNVRAFADTWFRYGRGDARQFYLGGQRPEWRKIARADAAATLRAIRQVARDARSGMRVRDCLAFAGLDVMRLAAQRAGLVSERRKLT